MVTTTRALYRVLAGVRPDAVFLASDFDGTLAEIRTRPEEVEALPEAINALTRLATRLGRVTIVSGRATAALARLLPVAGLRLLGDYGLGEPTSAERAALDALACELQPRLAAVPGAWLERKPGSATAHFRSAPQAGAQVERLVAAAAARHGLRWRRGRMVVEVMPARAGKAAALRTEIESVQPGVVVFAGDDTGDRGCFELLAGLPLPHVAVGVASGEAEPGLFDACDLVLAGPLAFAGLLGRLADWAEA